MGMRGAVAARPSRMRGLLAVVLGAVLAAGCGDAGASPDAEIELITGHQLAGDTSFQVGLEHFAELVEERTGGEVRVRVHAGAEIGSEMDMFQGMRMGTVDGAIVAPNSVAEFVPELQLLSMPFLVSSREQREAVLAGEVAERLEQLVAEQMGVEILGYFGGGVRNLFFTTPVDDADDLRGRLLRIQPSRVLNDSFAAMGLRPTLVDYGELYSALQQGVVDGGDNESLFVEAETFFTPAPYIVLTRHEVTIRPFAFSRVTLERLPDDVRKVVVEAAAEASRFAHEYEVTEDDAALERLGEEYGAELIEIDVQPLVEAVEPVWERYAAEWDMRDLLDAIRAERIEEDEA
jgi:TRAP-type transport system periplasmic protein